jgi:CHRD domain-containing protein
MKTTILRSSLAALACTAVLAFASPSMAANVNLKADLKGASEVPPVDSKGTGSVNATFDTASKKLSWKGTVTGLSGPATAAHFQSGEVGKNGGVTLPNVPAPTRARLKDPRRSLTPRPRSSWPASGTSTSIPRPTKAAKFAAR